MEGAVAGKSITLGAGLIGGGEEAAAIILPTVVTTTAIGGIALVSAITGAKVAALTRFAAKLLPLGAMRAVAAGGSGINWILHRRGMDRIGRENIEAGIFVGGLAAMITSSTGILPTPLTAIATASLVGGVAAGIFSLLRR